MAGELAGKVAIVTGAARGLGRGIAEVFLAEGAQVVIADVNEDQGRETAAGLGDNCRFLKTDVSEREQVQALVDLAVSEFGGLHTIVNNAGITDNLFAPLLEADFTAFRKVMDVNVLGVMLGTQIAGRHMARHGGGSVVNLSSISGVRPGFGFFTYRASKAAVINFTQSAASELGKHLIRVNCICPGNIPTEMGAYNNAPGDELKQGAIRDAVKKARLAFQPLQRQGDTHDIGNAAMFLASDRAAQISGQVLSVDGGSANCDSMSQIDAIMAARAEVEARFAE